MQTNIALWLRHECVKEHAPKHYVCYTYTKVEGSPSNVLGATAVDGMFDWMTDRIEWMPCLQQRTEL